MPQTFSDDEYIYSVDMMHAYINIFLTLKDSIKITSEEMSHHLCYKGWRTEGHIYSPIDVLNNPKKI